jgi:hypothetical protein
MSLHPAVKPPLSRDTGPEAVVWGNREVSPARSVQ